MDANGQRYWMLSEAGHYRLLGEPPSLEYDTSRRALRLRSQQRQQVFDDFETEARARLELVPNALDSYGNRVHWDPERSALIATGAMAGEVEIYRWPLPTDDADEESVTPSDIAMGFDGVLYIAVGGEILMQDRRERWDDVSVALADFDPWRIAADPRGGIWVLDRDSGQLARLQGRPLPKRIVRTRADTHARPCQENPDPPRLLAVESVQWPSGESPVALAVNGLGQVALLSWVEGGNAHVHFLESAAGSQQLQLSPPLEILGIRHPHSLAWVGNHRLALMLAGLTNQAPVIAATKELPAQIWPVGDIYPLKREHTGGPFLHSLDDHCYYPLMREGQTDYHALHKLSFPFYATRGEATQNPAATALDSRDPSTNWHRLYLEAVIPKDCGIRIWLASTNSPVIPNDLWYEHRFGEIYRGEAISEQPVAVWESIASEIPHHPGLLPCEQKENEAGLFSVLVQRSGPKVSRLRGRYLHVQIELTGTGRKTPEIYALRCYGSRFSYVDQYLPQLYRETLTGGDADALGPVTPADFTERFVANFEGVLTNIEDRIAQAHRLTDPYNVPEESLEWLADWIGYDFEEALPTAQRRRQLALAAESYRWRGTLRGLKLALEIATGGISGGEIVVMEDFRLRRTFATILGADLTDEDDPLTTGGAVSGNSFVGDTLFLGDELKKEFLALFAADLAVSTEESEAIYELFDRLAHRITVLVHNQVHEQDMGLIERIIEREIPAHVAFRVISASYPLLVGMAALVGVDTYLGLKPAPNAAQIDSTRIGNGDFITGPAALDPRLAGIGAGWPQSPERPPVAFAPDVSAGFGDDITLDGSGSRAFEGRNIRTYDWNFNEES